MFKFYSTKLIISSLLLISIVNARVVYILAHAEKPGEGNMDYQIEGGLTMSSMEGLGHKEDGLGYTGMLRTLCMMNNFGPSAPYYRQPKRIITQHFMLQNNGNYIHNGKRGHHTSRRMYHQTYALARSLGIDMDKELCCGGSYDDIVQYIYSLPPEDDPILIVNQHSVCNHIARSLSLSYGFPYEKDFGKEPSKVWTFVDGEHVEEWYMCCKNIVNSRCTDPNIKPAWVNKYNFQSTQPRAPLPNVYKFPSYIYTPRNIHSRIQWSYSNELRKRGVWSGEECLNEDLVKPIANLSRRGDIDDDEFENDNNNNSNNNSNNSNNNNNVNNNNNNSITNQVNLSNDQSSDAPSTRTFMTFVILIIITLLFI